MIIRTDIYQPLTPSLQKTRQRLMDKRRYRTRKVALVARNVQSPVQERPAMPYAN